MNVYTKKVIQLSLPMAITQLITMVTGLLFLFFPKALSSLYLSISDPSNDPATKNLSH